MLGWKATGRGEHGTEVADTLSLLEKAATLGLVEGLDWVFRCLTVDVALDAGLPGELHLTLGSVDAALAAQLQPLAHVHWADRVPWIGEIHDGLPRHEATGSS